MTERVYLDHNASAPMRPEAAEAVANSLKAHGNPSSVHGEGRAARALVERAREQVAALVGADPRKVVFTSGGTESNVAALSPRNAGSDNAACFMGGHEHPSVLAGGRFPVEQIRLVDVGHDGVIDLAALEAAINQLREEDDAAPFMVSVMFANNETGALQPVAEIAEMVRRNNGIMHCDAIQAAGKVPVDIGAIGAHILSISAHKIGGPQGAGALVLGKGMAQLHDPLITGGGQELRARSGTENVPGIAGFGVAAELAARELAAFARLAELRDGLEQAIMERAPDAVIFAKDTARLPNTTNFAVPGMRSERLIIGLDLAGVAVSAGSSCSSGKVEQSHVLAAMGIDAELARDAIRVSLGWNTSARDIDRFIAAWSGIHEQTSKSAVAA